MNQNILQFGLDVDDTQYHGSAFNKDSAEKADTAAFSVCITQWPE